MLALAGLSVIHSNSYHYVVLLSRVSTADAQAQNDTNALMANLVFIYWDDFPCVAEPPEASPTTAGASANTSND